MCLIFFAFDAHERYRLVLAANRDEFYARPSEPARFWEKTPTLLAGKDLQGGGTWCGVTLEGKFAAVTNYRDVRALKNEAPSRGALLTRFLLENVSPDEYAEQLDRNGAPYNGYNLLFGRFQGGATELWYQSNQIETARRLERGVYGLSNHLLDTPWHKVERGKRMFAETLSSHTGGERDDKTFAENLFALLADTAPADDGRLPDTGLSLEWERMLSPMFITSEQYGTRSSTVIFIDRDNRTTFIERTHKTATNPEAAERRFSFSLSS